MSRLAARATADEFRALADHQLAVLSRLADVGLKIAVALEEQAKGGAVVVQGDVAMAYNRVARAVRQTLMLQTRIIEALRGLGEARAGRRAAARSSAARIIRDAIDDDPGKDRLEGAERRERLEHLHGEAAERLHDEDFEDLLARPFGEAVAHICRELGLTPDWLKLAEDCWAAETALSGKAGAADGEEPYDGPITVRWLNSTPRVGDSS